MTIKNKSYQNKPRLIRITTIPLSLDLLLTNQMNFFSNKGFEVFMISANGNNIARLVERERCPHTIIPFTRKISIIQDLKCLWLLLKFIKKEKPNIIHTHTPKAGLLGMLAAKICGVELKIHTIAGLPLMTAKGGKRKLLEFIEKLTYWSADYVLPNSNSIMSFVKAHGFTKDSKLDMIGRGSSNGIDLNRFSRRSIQGKKFQQVKDEIDYEEGYRYILVVGRVVRDKGIIEVITAFLQLYEQLGGIRLIIVGPLEEERKEELLPIHILSELKSNLNIKHISWSDEVEYYMCLADVLIHASYREGFPNVPLQAGAMECPIICSEISGNIDIVTNNTTGLYFKVGNVKDLVEKLAFALSNYDLMKTYAKVLRKEIEENFSREYIHQELFKFYNKKLNETR